MKNNKWWLLGIKSWGNMLIAIVVCFMLALFFGLDSVIVKIIVQIVDIAFFGGLLYRFFWKAGSSDSNRVELKMGEKDILKGVKSGIIAAVPFLILWILLLAAKLSGVSEKTGDILMFVYSFLNTPFSPVINSIFFSFRRQLCHNNSIEHCSDIVQYTFYCCCFGNRLLFGI